MITRRKLGADGQYSNSWLLFTHYNHTLCVFASQCR